MQPQHLKDALIWLYGERGWQTKAARVLGADTSTIRRWCSGAIAVPGPVIAAVEARLGIPDD
jgi:hypothetical protein